MSQRTTLLTFLLFAMLFCAYPCCAREPLLSDLMRDSSETQDRLVVFTTSTVGTHFISGISLHFLTGIDCYSGYLAPYQIAHANEPFPISNDTNFSLSARGMYQAAQSAVRSQPIDSIQSVLIRFPSTERGTGSDRFLRFTGSCQDQEINCCLPIACAQATEQCVPLASMDRQGLVW